MLYNKINKSLEKNYNRGLLQGTYLGTTPTPGLLFLPQRGAGVKKYRLG
jgi:hypothetical protein